MSLKKPIAEICTGLFCLWRPQMKDQQFDSLLFTADNFFSQFSSGSEYQSCTFSHLDLTGHDFSGTKFLDCQFENCNLSNALFKKGTLRNCEFRECKLVGVDWSQTQALIYPRFEKCVLDFGIFNSMSLKKTVFTGCSLREVDFFSTKLNESDFSGTLLSGSNFSRADLTECDFRGARDYSIEPIYTIINKAKFSLPEAMALLKSFDVVIE